VRTIFLSDLKYVFRSEWLRKTVSRVIIQIMEDPRGELCRALSDLAYFPALSATVSFNNKASCHEITSAIYLIIYFSIGIPSKRIPSMPICMK
jgi:hypothetical protein